MYDAIVIGARCAGSPTAMLLARKGYRVLLVDKATFPSDIINNYYIHQPGVARLQRWGLLEKVRASNCPPVLTWTFDIGPFALTGSPPPAGKVAEGYAPRRRVIDTILVHAAVAAGSEVREGFVVQELIDEGERITGIRGRTAGGAPVTEQARIVIGADGMHSLVAHTVHAATYNTKPSLACWYYAHWSGVPLEGAEVYQRDHRLVGALPTNDGLVLIFVGWPHQEFHEFRADIKGNFLKTLDLVPGLAARVRNGMQVERFMGTADLPNFFRKPYGPGWALVGDAGYHKDPLTAQGFTDAFRDAELLSEAIDDGFAGRRPLLEALAEYERQRNAAALPMYEFTCELATLEPPSAEQMQLFAALRGNQAETNRFFGTMVGTVSIPEFFALENIQRISEGGKA
ncbi:MAG: FAD-dependent monooxygenase [Deltaproteobacteria bacterium]|nr:FAD-dependent monooxygenase [Deltaproteobacteria bacterium]